MRPESIQAAGFDLSLHQHFIGQRQRLREAAQRILGCPHRAEDVVQDAYLKIHEVPASFDIRQPQAYLLRIVRNLAIDRHRRSAFESDVFAAEEDGLAVHEEAQGPEAIAIGRQTLARISQALDSLPARTRRAFELYRLAGLSQREIASELGVSVTLVNFLIRDALASCRQHLA
ncbi:RNA polymerase factor sigma-70 [Herbaspirillum rubrisubalbicans]|uniref:Extracytoplasmic-function sigma-70 factor n=2 Tax=Herbaspirillum rubrisubalbicans TaxID=80842 RepID=A0ABX9BXW9_9BURK|nr:RNA polymerase factor sigma-70 [Herbaspirillum rubrisubalbicans]MCP1572419.1 RNA polymerase sigma-70 factor (ECF subfamily) [Herbaspirillum rubrisubalbicans]NQE50622.1 extracytoplasmic-function sigma-70 factor [Herbaspirillum rubrisubalbicans]QJQ01053.1 RNA polymerase factor sigma-70 [Herbaspirillum rubrisubalbicans Os34]RAM62820.1 extracytoplasmic-function sigma-70 factor [Herbaspirillum rubrisubalbicans]